MPHFMRGGGLENASMSSSATSSTLRSTRPASDSHIDKALERAFDGPIHAMSALRGGVGTTALTRWALMARRETNMRVRDLMTRDVATCGRGDSLAWAAQLMWDHDCGVVPVIDPERRVVAMLTDRDICMAAWSKGRPLADLRVADAASRSLHTIGEDDPIELAEARMRAQQVRRLPVVDGTGHLLGILSLNDVARQVRQVSSHPYEGLGSESVALTLAVVSRPRSSSVPDARPDGPLAASA
jgi:CBS-domain-containing membrane protein